MAAKGLKCPKEFDVKEIREGIDDIMVRNSCAHSTWTWNQEHSGWTVAVTRGQWSGIPKVERARRNKRLFIEGQIIRSETLKVYVTGAGALRKAFQQLQASLRVKVVPPLRDAIDAVPGHVASSCCKRCTLLAIAKTP
jgi:hypothetical protein